MANDTQDVRMHKAGSTKVWIFPRNNVPKLKALGWVEETEKEKPKEESDLTKLGRGAALGTFEGAGVATTLHPVQDTLKGLREQFQTMAGKQGWQEALKANPAVAIPTSLGKGFLDITEDINPALDKLIKKFSTITGGRQFKDESTGFDVERTAQDIAKMATQVALLKGGKKAAETPIAESELLSKAGPSVRKGARSVLGASEHVVERARTTAEEAATKKMAEYTEKKAKYDEKVAEAKAEHEAKIAEKQAKHEADVEAAKATHQAKLDAAEQSLSGKVTREAHARLKENRLNQATKKLEATRDQLVKETAKNLDAAETAEKQSLDARYEDFRRKVLGVTPETPNGTLQAELSPIGEAIQHAKSNVMKGSRTNVTIFNDIMGRMKDMVEAPDGSLKPLEGQMIPADQLRGYYKELGDAIYEKELPGDVRRALDYVRENINHQIERSIEDVAGKKALDVYHKLSEDYSGYKRVWYDRSSGSPLPRILKTMRSPVALHEGVNMEGQIADLLGRKHAGQSITTLLAKKMPFGAKPELVARLMAVTKKLGELPDLYETIPVAKYPRFPGEFKAEEAPKPEPFKEKGEPPEKPNIEKFDAEKFVREKLESRINTMGNWGMGFTALSALTDLLHGNAFQALSLAEKIAVMQAIKSVLTSGKALSWLTKGVQ